MLYYQPYNRRRRAFAFAARFCWLLEDLVRLPCWVYGVVLPRLASFLNGSVPTHAALPATGSGCAPMPAGSAARRAPATGSLSANILVHYCFTT